MNKHKKFVAIHYFRPFYDSVADLFSDENIEQFIENIRSEKGKRLCAENNLTDKDVEEFIQSVKNPSTMVFQGWIEYKTAIYNLLTDKKDLEVYMDNFGHLSHKLSDDYRKYLSPFLASRIIERISGADKEELEKLFSFAPLLDKDHAILVENELMKPIRKLIDNVNNNADLAKNEQHLIDEVTYLCSDEIISSVNYLSRSSYGAKVNYVDSVLAFINHPACTVRFANWILKRMEKVELNKEHQKKIIALKADLKNGILKTQNNGKKKAVVFKMNKLFLYIFLGVLFSGAIYVIVEKPFNEVEETVFTKETAFTQFSKEERLQLDSLMKNMNGLQRSNEVEFDFNMPLTGESAQLTMAKVIPNDLLNEVCENILKFSELKLQKFIDSCSVEKKFTTPKEMSSLSGKKGKEKVMIKSDSEYDVLIFVAENKKDGRVYVTHLKKNENTTFNVNNTDLMVVIPGNNYSAIEMPDGLDEALLPSGRFENMFCEIDMNTVENTMITYQFSNCRNNTNKLLVSGHIGGYFQLVDLYGMLSEFE